MRVRINAHTCETNTQWFRRPMYFSYFTRWIKTFDRIRLDLTAHVQSSSCHPLSRSNPSWKHRSHDHSSICPRVVIHERKKPLWWWCVLHLCAWLRTGDARPRRHEWAGSCATFCLIWVTFDLHQPVTINIKPFCIIIQRKISLTLLTNDKELYYCYYYISLWHFYFVI